MRLSFRESLQTRIFLSRMALMYIRPIERLGRARRQHLGDLIQIAEDSFRPKQRGPVG